MPPTDPQHATRLLARLQAGDASAGPVLMELVYGELRGIAGRNLRGQAPGHTLQPTALVHEAWMRLVQADGEGFESRGHFMAVAAKAMRRILLDHARARAADKRGGDWKRVTISRADDERETGVDVLDLEVAMERLAAEHPRQAQVAELRFFAGLDVEEVAAVLEVSPRSVKYDWRFARAYLRRLLEGDAA